MQIILLPGRDKNTMNKKLFRSGIIVVFGSLIVSALILFNIFNADANKNRNEAKILLQNQASVIAKNFIANIERSYALRAFIVGSRGYYDNIDMAADYIYKAPHVRNILIAPGSVVRKVLPLAGNEAVLGMDLTSKSNKSYKDAIAAINSRKPVFSDPYALAQGGNAISVRLAIYIKDKAGNDRYWGLTSITLNHPDAISSIATNYIVDSGYDYILLKKMSSTGEYQSVSEHRETKRSDFVTYDFSVQNMDFRFCTVPKAGWVNIGKISLFALLAIFISIAAGLIVSSIMFLANRFIEKAGKDALTGLLNRESGVRRINKRVKEGTFRKGALVLMDIDHFKNVNDTMGHPKGDEVLIETAMILKELCRREDIICRLGGDEFVVFFSYDTSSYFLRPKVESIRERMQRTITSEENSVDISSSFGVSFISDENKRFDTLYKEADLALYRSKECGRNRATFYKDTQTETTDS